MDELLAMETFKRVVETGSFSRAASQLGASQGTVSRRVADLESRLGVTLLRRTTRRVALTPIGEAYFEKCTIVLAAVDDARGVTRQARTAAGRLRAAVPLTYAAVWLGPRLSDFLARYPEIQVELLASNQRVSLIEEGVDVALRIGEAHLQDAHARHLGTTTRIAVASPSYLDAYGAPELDDVERHEVLVYGLADSGRAWAFTANGRARRLNPEARVVADSGQVLAGVARAGGGVVVLPDWLVEDDLRQGTLVRVLEDAAFEPSAIRALWLGRRRPTGVVRAFVDWLVEMHDMEP